MTRPFYDPNDSDLRLESLVRVRGMACAYDISSASSGIISNPGPLPSDPPLLLLDLASALIRNVGSTTVPFAVELLLFRG